MATHDAGTKLDQLYRRVTMPIARRVARYPHVTPNRVSVTAFLAGGVITPILILLGHMRLAGGAYILSDLLDYLDGDIARAQGTASAQGDILDGIMDRYTDFFCVAAITLSASGLLGAAGTPPAAFVGVPDMTVAVLIGLGAIVGSMMPSYVQALAVANGKHTVQSIGGRGTRNRVVFVGLLLGEPFWTLAFIAALSNAGTIHRAAYTLSDGS